MNDLIRRSDLIMHLSDYALNASPNDNESTSEQRISRMIYNAIQNCISYVENQPTAYDIDKVVEELNELDVTAIKRYEGGTFGNYEGTDYYIEKSRTIEIVKRGGKEQ